MTIDFDFEHTYKWTKDQYVELNRLFSKKTRWMRRILISSFGILCLFWSYTILLGIGTLAMVALVLFTPHIAAGSAAHRFLTSPFLQEKMTYGVSNKGLWMYGSLIEVRMPWNSVQVWDERDGWLRVCPNGSPPLWFPVSKLNDAGIYDQVIELCEENGVRYNSRGDRNRRPSWLSLLA
jgi:hypothetical protein